MACYSHPSVSFRSWLTCLFAILYDDNLNFKIVSPKGYIIAVLMISSTILIRVLVDK